MFSFGGKAADGYFCNFRPFHLHLQMVHIPDLSLAEQLVHLQNGPLQRVSLGHVESASLASLLLEALKMGARSLRFLMAILIQICKAHTVRSRTREFDSQQVAADVTIGITSPRSIIADTPPTSLHETRVPPLRSDL
ncbi:hypothetical protein CMV_018982 [Castanea mollissima]|uniref:Uncharacterized protein n=1 Tax=Castanea mollissima TaxID=60419 RepID=A0A8J4R1A3_9ROSI|nr:hypothetical protein CMV_018982 [Castanea mollissima]